MLLQVNQNALGERIEREVEGAIQKISSNAQNGISVTEITFENDIFFKCRIKLNEYMKENNVNFGWLDMGGYVSLNYGTHRLAKFKLKQ
jgi:hypothetical protein